MRFIPIFLTIVLVLTIAGCHKNADPSQESLQQSTADATTNDLSPSAREHLELYFDLDKVQRPTEAAILSIKEGTHITEVIKLLGKPHRVSEGNELLLAWDSIEGGTYCILFRAEKPTSDSVSPLEHEMTHSIVIREALRLPPKTDSDNSSAEPQTPTEQPALTEPTDPNFP